jgi:hypothetical protein
LRRRGFSARHPKRSSPAETNRHIPSQNVVGYSPSRVLNLRTDVQKQDIWHYPGFQNIENLRWHFACFFNRA